MLRVVVLVLPLALMSWVTACGSPSRKTSVVSAPRPSAEPSTEPVIYTPPKASPDEKMPVPYGARPHTPADVRFITGMIGHHAQAVIMAGWAPTHGAGSALRVLCERIKVGQADEIELMQTWLRDHNEPLHEASHHDMLMPGMLTDEQMMQLDHATGREFDRLFLTFMIQHHRGALAMVETLFKSPGGANEDAMYKFASDVLADQTIEIERMQRMLDAMIKS